MIELSNTDNQTLSFVDRGLTAFEPMWQEQKQLQRSLIEGTGQQTIIFCEHSPVITLSKAASRENILLSEAALKEKKVELFSIERGGDVTFHGPGQLVVYPILDLNRYRRDVGWYMRTLEEIIIAVLHDFSIQGEQINGKTGVWINNRKLASIGVRFSRWCSMHGLSMNVLSDLSGYDLINPCGFTDITMTSIALENPSLQQASLMDDVKISMRKHITERFGKSS